MIPDDSRKRGDGNIYLQMNDLKRASTADNIIIESTIFEPHTSIGKRESNATASNSNIIRPKQMVRAPEKTLTLFALRLAILEKTATGLGTLSFIWATVVLLGGFAITLDTTDFWFITIILLTEAARIFGRSHELEWQQQSAWSPTDAELNSYPMLRSSSMSITRVFKTIFSPMSSVKASGQEGGEITPTANRDKHDKDWVWKRLPSRQWASSDVPILPYTQWVFLSRNISKLLHWIQIVAATACVVLSAMKLMQHNYGTIEKGDTDKRNRKAALTIFYCLALAEALLFLLEKAYWELKVIRCKVLEEVSNECELGPAGLVPVRRFFYDAYSKCVNGSIFDGLKMDMVSFGIELLGMETPEEQLIGARILRKLVTSERFSNDALQKIGVTLSVMERLVEMLNWKDPQEEEIRYTAAIILSKLAGKKQNSLRVAGIPGAMESISSLLYTNREPSFKVDEIGDRGIFHDHEQYGFWTFSHLGLLILKKTTHDIDNCGKIGNTKGLIPKIVDFTHAGERLLKDETADPSQIITVKRALQVLRMLASTAGSTGKQLRRDISEIVFTFSNLRDILRYGEKHPTLQHLGIEILTSLAIEEDATERIGGTGRILKELLNIFLKERVGPENQKCVRIAAGEALAMLTLDSESNCHRVVRAGALEKLVGSLEDELLRLNGARILRNLCTYTGDDCFEELRGVVVTAVPMVLRGIMSERNKLQEVMLGLAARAFKFMSREESRAMFEIAGVTEFEIASKLVEILRRHPEPPHRIPRIRRFAVELAIWMMRNGEASSTCFFRDLGLADELQYVLNTTSEIENFHMFSGTVGLSRYRTTIHSLVEMALELVHVDEDPTPLC